MSCLIFYLEMKAQLIFLQTGGKYTKADFKEYEKECNKPSKFTLKEKVKPNQEYP